MVLAACGEVPAGVDGDITDDWGGFPPLAGFVPEAPACHPQDFRPVAPLAEYQPVDCGQPHLVETVYVGELEGEAAELPAPPAADSSVQQEAYEQCEQQVADGLGADFREGRLWLGVAMPAERAWAAGARWFRCDLQEVASVYGDPVERTGSLAGGLADEGSPLRLRCFSVAAEEDAVAEMAPVGCEEPHDAEFVGVWRAPGEAYPDQGDAEAEVYQGCREQVAAYVDVPVDGDLIYRTGTIADWISEQEWQAGDRGFRCYLWLPGRDLTESLAGAGGEALPVQTE